MYSVTMLPEGKKLDHFFSKCKEKEIKLAFVLENFIAEWPFNELENELNTYKMGNFECSGEYLSEVMSIF